MDGFAGGFQKKEAWKWTFERMSRYCFVGATLDLKASNEEPKVNHWCELSSLRLFDASGKNVAPLASRISFTQKPGEGDETHADLKVHFYSNALRVSRA